MPRLRLSTAQTLSLATAGVVVVVLATATAIVWANLTTSALHDTQDGLNRSVRQLVSVSAASIRAGQSRYARIAEDTVIVNALRPGEGADRRAVQRVLQRLVVSRADSELPVELWNASGRRIAQVGLDSSEQVQLSPATERGTTTLVHTRGLDSLRNVDSLQLGALERVGDHTLFWLVMPVRVNHELLGFVAQRRQIAASPQAEATIRELSGKSASGYYRNIDGTAWTTFGGAGTVPPDSARSGHDIRRARAAIGQILVAEARVPGSPLVMGMEVPRTAVVAGPNATARRLAAFGGLLTIVGAILAWMIGWRVTRPLTELTQATESLARGDYSARVPTGGSEEVARLAKTFNRMATHIDESRSMLEAREAELRTMSDAIPQLAWMADRNGEIFWFNERWYDFTGASDDWTTASMWLDAHDPEEAPEVLRRWRECVASGTPLEMEVRLRNRAGEHCWFLTRVAPMRHEDGHISRWFGTSTDIQTLRDAREAAEAGNRAKSDFLAAMSHELRTPLNAIGGYAELMELGVRGPITDEQRRDLARIRASQAHLLGLIGSLLDLSRIESGRVAYELVSIALDPFLSGVEGLVGPQAAAKQQRLMYTPCDPELAVIADREKLRQIVLNLLSNAVRYSPNGASITLSASKRDQSTVAIEVQDTGPGIPLDRQHAIFEPFVQLERSLTHSAEGVGLGLAISRDLAHGMGGELSVVSAPGKGACFAVLLPVGVFDDDTQLSATYETRSVAATT